MKILKFGNSEDEQFKAEKVIKTDTDIIGYINNIEVFAFRGISDFSRFSLDGGQEFDIPLLTIQEIQLKNEKLETQLAQTNADMQALMEYISAGGN